MKYFIIFYLAFFVNIELTAQKNIYNPSDVDIQAEYKGGDRALFNFIFAEFKYPQCSNFADHSTVKFRINKKGRVKDIEIFKTSHCEAFDKEYIRVVKKMPRWKPAERNGKKVNMSFILPIRFHLEG